MNGANQDREYFMQRYNVIYKELNRLQNGMDEMQACADKLLNELKELREKEQETFNENGEV